MKESCKNFWKRLSILRVAVLILCVSSVALSPTRARAQSLTLFPCSGGINNSVATGATGGGAPSNGQRECNFGDVVEVAQAVANKIVQIGLLLSPFIFAYAGWLLLTSGANPGNRKKAQGIFLNVVIGLAIMLGAWLAVKLVLTALVSSTILNNQAFPLKTN